MFVEKWIETFNLNCYTDSNNGNYYGATDILPDPWTQANGDFEECKRACLKNVDCTGLIWGKRSTSTLVNAKMLGMGFSIRLYSSKIKNLISN